jgi:hypothetical protein
MSDKARAQIIDKTTGEVVLEGEVEFKRAYDEAYPGFFVFGEIGIGRSDEIVEMENVKFDVEHECWCSRETLMRDGCKCGGK